MVNYGVRNQERDYSEHSAEDFSIGWWTGFFCASLLWGCCTLAGLYVIGVFG